MGWSCVASKKGAGAHFPSMSLFTLHLGSDQTLEHVQAMGNDSTVCLPDGESHSDAIRATRDEKGVDK
jgi:hypothetical protein